MNSIISIIVRAQDRSLCELCNGTQSQTREKKGNWMVRGVATRSLSPNAKIARRVSFSFHCEISKNSIIINRGQGGRCRGREKGK